MRAIQFSRRIRKREQFFLWARGVLQALVPHEILFCALRDSSKKYFVTDRYTARPFPETAYRDLCNAPKGLLQSAYGAWEDCGNTPLLMCPEKGDAWLIDRFGEAIDHYGLVNCAFHGMPQYHGGSSSFFCFARMPGPLGARHASLLDIVLPYLHVAFVRTLVVDHQPIVQRFGREGTVTIEPVLRKKVTAREVQILQWVQEGKSNREIGEILSISQFTVKNHVQNILKKLNVKNRTQAVSFALAAQLIVAQPAAESGWAGTKSGS